MKLRVEFSGWKPWPPKVGQQPDANVSAGHSTPPASRFALHPICLTLALALTATLAQAEATPESPAGKPPPAENAALVQVIDGRLTAWVEAVPLGELLQEIARQTPGFALDPYGARDEKVSIQLEQAPLDEGLRLILGRRSFALEYSDQTPEGTPSPARRPSKLWVLSGGDRDHRAPVVVRNRRGDPRRDRILDDESLDARLASQDPEEREAAVEALAESERPDAIALLSLALGDGEEDVRDAAIDALAEMGGDQATQALSIALRDQDSSLRDDALEALVEIGGNRAAQAVSVALHDADSWLREDAVEALEEIGGDTAVEALAVALEDEDASVREEAIEALEAIGGEEAMSLVEQAKANEDDIIE